MDTALSNADVSEATSVSALLSLVEARAAGGQQLPLGFCMDVMLRGAELEIDVHGEHARDGKAKFQGDAGFRMAELLVPSLRVGAGDGKLGFGRAA